MWHENLQSCQPSYEGDIYYFADEKIKSERRSASRSRSQQNSRDRVHSLHPTPAGALTGSESKVAIYYSPLPAISSVVVKTSVTPTRTTTKDSNKCGQGCGESETLAHGWWECKIVHPLWKTMWQLLRNDASLPYDVVSLLPSMYVLKSIIMSFDEHVQPCDPQTAAQGFPQPARLPLASFWGSSPPPASRRSCQAAFCHRR